MPSNVFSIIPIEVALDKRLTLEQTRVLIALFSFRGKDSYVVWPSRSLISERTGMHINNISVATTRLMNLGWLVKEGAGGNGKSTRYTITIPNLETVAEQATVAQSTTVAQSARGTVAEQARGTVAQSATRIEQTNEVTNEVTTTSSLDTREASQEDKQPGGASSGGDGPHNGEPAEPVDSAKAKRKAAIPRNWEPDAACLDLLEKAGISREFSESLVGEFRLYWVDRGVQRPGWNATFLNHAKAQWTRQQERPKSGTIVTPYRSGAAHPPTRAGADFRTFSEMRAQRNIEIALEFANEQCERVINE